MVIFLIQEGLQMGNIFRNTIWRSHLFSSLIHIDCFFFCLSFFFRGIGVGPHTTHLQREKIGGGKGQERRRASL